MKIKRRGTERGCLLEAIGGGEVFYSETDPFRYLLRINDTFSDDCWAAIDIETGVLYDYNDLPDGAQYHIVQAEVAIL